MQHKHNYIPKFYKAMGPVRFMLTWAFPEKFGPLYANQKGISLKLGYHSFWLGNGKPKHDYPVSGDLFAVALRMDGLKLKFRFNACLNVKGCCI